MSAPLRLWAVMRPDGSLVPWTVHHSAKGARHEGARYCMGAGEYERLVNDRARWQYLYQRGHRLVRVTLTIEADSDAK